MLPHFLDNITLSATVVVSRCVDHRKLSGERPGQYWGGDPPKAGRAGQGVHRLAPGGIGCTRELQRGGPGGIGCTQGVHLYFETSPDHAVRSDQMAVSLKISFGKQKKEQFCTRLLVFD